MAAGRTQWVAGGMPATSHGGGMVRLIGETTDQRERGEGKMSRGTAGSPSMRRCTRWWRERADGDGIMAAAVGRRRRGRRRWWRSRAPELNPFHQKNEDGEAEQMAASVGPGEASVDSDAAAAQLGHGHGAGRLGFRQGEKGGRGGAAGRGRGLYPPGGGLGARRPRWRRHGDGDRGGSVTTVATGRRS